MRKLFLLLAFFAVSNLTAQGNGDYVNMTFVKTTPGEDYGTIINEKWKELAQMRADEGTITGVLFNKTSHGWLNSVWRHVVSFIHDDNFSTT